MTFLELLDHIQSQKEKILTHNATEIITEKSRYCKIKNAGSWEKDMAPGSPKSTYTRSGEVFVWARDVEETVVSEPAKATLEQRMAEAKLLTTK